MNLLDEVTALQEVGHPVEGVVVDQDRAEQSLLGVDVGGRDPIGALLRRLAWDQSFDCRHGR